MSEALEIKLAFLVGRSLPFVRARIDGTTFISYGGVNGIHLLVVLTQYGGNLVANDALLNGTCRGKISAL